MALTIVPESPRPASGSTPNQRAFATVAEMNRLAREIEAGDATIESQTFSGAVTVTDTTDSTTINTGSIVTDGGVGIEKALFIGTTLNSAGAANLATGSGVTTIGSATPAVITAAGVLAIASTTDSTTKDTGSIITEGGIGVEKAIVTGTSITSGTNIEVGTSINVGTNQTFTKEVNHSISVSNTTTAATAGGNISITSAKGSTSGAGGDMLVTAGQGGATGVGGNTTINTGAGGATSGNSGILALSTGTATLLGDSGAINVTTGAAVVGATGTVTISSGNTASGRAGDVVLTTGTQTSTTVKAVVSLNKAVIRKPESATTASGGTITGPELVGGLITATGATGNWQLPTAAQITTAIGSTPAGTNFEFVFNAAGMTATNTATLVVGTNMTVASAPAITGGGTLTVTQDTQVVARFWVCYDTATTCKISRVV